MFTLNFNTIHNLTNSKDAIVIFAYWMVVFFSFFFFFASVYRYSRLKYCHSYLFCCVASTDTSFINWKSSLSCSYIFSSVLWVVETLRVISVTFDHVSFLWQVKSPTNDGSGNCSEMKLRLNSTETVSVTVRHCPGRSRRVLRSL